MNNFNSSGGPESQSVDLTPVVTQLQQSNQILNAILATLQAAFPQVTGTSATASGGAATLPANPVSFITILVNGTTYKIPIYS